MSQCYYEKFIFGNIMVIFAFFRLYYGKTMLISLTSYVNIFSHDPIPMQYRSKEDVINDSR